MNIKTIGILYHPKVQATLDKARELENSLTMQGVSAWVYSAWEKDEIKPQLEGTDLLLTVGGDGTILRAIQAVIPGNTPITGINQGKLGFLTEFDADEAIKKIPLLLIGPSWYDERAMLQAELLSQGQEKQIFHALNDVVIGRGEVARIIQVDVAIDGQPLTTWKTDAVIAATATGSTGYALAAKGPIMHPQSHEILLTPVAPHLSFPYSLILPETAEITLRLNTYHAATLSIDGHVNLPLADGDAVTIKRSPHTARFFRIRAENSFYLSLEEKLKGNQGESGRKS